MNFYLLSVLVVLCFGPWTVAREAYRQRLTKNRSEVTEEPRKRGNADTKSPIIDGLVRVASRARTWIQWSRRLLKTLRKWCASHPFEVKLGKCLAGYLNAKPSGPGRRGKIARDHGDPKGEGSPWKISKEMTLRVRALTPRRPGRERTFGEGPFQKISLFRYSRDFLTEVGSRLRHYRDIMFRENFVLCLWDYFWKKFWIWVDSAPDPPM